MSKPAQKIIDELCDVKVISWTWEGQTSKFGRMSRTERISQGI